MLVNGHGTLLGTSEGDTIEGSNEGDVIYAGEGNDRIDAGGDEDFIFPYSADFEFTAPPVFSINWGNDWVTGGAGNGQIDYSNNIDSVHIFGDQDPSNMDENTAWNTDGNDTIIGSDHWLDSRFDGTAGDEIRGGYGNDKIHGGTGDDTIYGDYVAAENVNDKVNGRYVHDVHGGQDVITGGMGADTLYGGGGHDYFVYKDGDSNVLTAVGQKTMDTIGDFDAQMDHLVMPVAGTPDNFLFEMNAPAINSPYYVMGLENEARRVFEDSYQHSDKDLTYVFQKGFYADDGYLFADFDHDGVLDMGIKFTGLGRSHDDPLAPDFDWNNIILDPASTRTQILTGDNIFSGGTVVAPTTDHIGTNSADGAVVAVGHAITTDLLTDRLGINHGDSAEVAFASTHVTIPSNLTTDHIGTNSADGAVVALGHTATDHIGTNNSDGAVVAIGHDAITDSGHTVSPLPPGQVFDGNASWGGTITGTAGVDTLSYASAKYVRTLARDYWFQGPRTHRRTRALRAYPSPSPEWRGRTRSGCHTPNEV